MQDVASLLQISYCSQSTIPHNTLESWCNCHKYIITDNITEKAFTGISWRMTSDSAARRWSPRNLQLNKLLAYCNDIMSSLHLYWHDEIPGKKNPHLYMCCTLNTCKLCIWWYCLTHCLIHSLSLLPVMFSNGEQVVFLQAACSCLFNSVSCYLFFFSPLVLLLFFSCCCFWFGDHGALQCRAGIVVGSWLSMVFMMYCFHVTAFVLVISKLSEDVEQKL